MTTHPKPLTQFQIAAFVVIMLALGTPFMVLLASWFLFMIGVWA